MKANRSINLATVGEAVRSYWPRRDPDDENEEDMKVKSGTSFATPIAAATAAFLLSFAQRYLPEIAENFKTFDNMRNLIETICQESTHLDYVAPDFCSLYLSKNPDNLFGKGQEKIMEVFRKSLVPLARG